MAAAAPEEWIAGLVESPGSAVIVLWYEPETDLVVDIHMTAPGLAEAPALFQRVTEQPKAGPPRRPRRVRVADPVLADALRGRIGDVEVVLGDISAAQEALVSLAEHLTDRRAVPEIAPSEWARYFRAAARFWRTRPWDVIPADEWIAVECEQLEIKGGALTVVGQAGESMGFMLCRTAEDAAAWLDAGERRSRGEDAPLPLCYMFGYDERDDLDPDDLEEIAKQGWEVAAPSAYPRLTVFEPDGDSRLPDRAEVFGVTAIIEAVCAMVEDEPDLGDAWTGDPVDWEGEIDGRRVRLGAGLQLPDAPVDPADASIDILGADGVVDEQLLERHRVALMTRLAARDEIPDDVLAAAEMLVEFAAQYHGATFARIGPETLEALLLETIPAQLAVEPDEAPRILAAARELIRLAGEELDHGQGARALALLDDARVERDLRRELANPDNFATGKQLVMHGIAEGYDMSTEEGVADFVRAFAAQAQAEAKKPSKRPAKAKKPAAKAKKPAAKAKKPAAKAKKPAAKAKKPAAKAKKPAAKAKKAAAKSKKSAAKSKRR